MVWSRDNTLIEAELSSSPLLGTFARTHYLKSVPNYTLWKDIRGNLLKAMKHLNVRFIKNLMPVFEPFRNNRVKLTGSPKLDLMMIGVLLNIDLYLLLMLDGFLHISDITGHVMQLRFMWFFHRFERKSLQIVKNEDKFSLLYSLTFGRTDGLLAWPDFQIRISDALFNVVNIIRDGTGRLKIPQRFEDGGADVLKGFLIWSLVWESWIPLCALCLSQRGVNEWGMNNAGQDPIVWWGPSAAQGAAQETLWNIDSPLKSCCVDVGLLVGCEWRFFPFSSLDRLTSIRLGKQASGLILVPQQDINHISLDWRIGSVKCYRWNKIDSWRLASISHCASFKLDQILCFITKKLEVKEIAEKHPSRTTVWFLTQVAHTWRL